MSSTGDLLRDLQAADPSVNAIVAAHLANYDEVLPHVLMGEITQWLVAEGPRARVLAALEHHHEVGDEHVRDVIAASFLENLIGEDAIVRRALGPRLAAELRQIEEWEPDAGEPPT
jgi:hypothetical protein